MDLINFNIRGEKVVEGSEDTHGVLRMKEREKEKERGMGVDSDGE